MQPLVIDLRGITPDLLRPSDNPVLADAVRDAVGPTHAADGYGFSNKL